MNDIKSIYIHIPFCKDICAYCDFCKMYYNEESIDKYLVALEKEIKTFYKNEEIETIYIGGGTPSCLKKEQLKKLFSITNMINIKDNYEFTFECNVHDINEEFLKQIKNNKVNRISIGVQSFNKKVLNILGRKYNIDIKEKIHLAKKCFDNINIDLIFGISNQSMNDLKKDLNKFADLNVNHISIYSLILEDNTILKINNYKEIEDDLSRKMYDYICYFLKEKGYNHYEISNFEKGNTQSKHNLTYWNNNKYYGFGLGASGYIENIRYTNTRSLSKYLKGEYRAYFDKITKRIDMENFMILGLRKLSGISNKEFNKKYGKDIEDVFDTKKLKKDKDYYFIPEDMLYISNNILQDFIDI